MQEHFHSTKCFKKIQKQFNATFPFVKREIKHLYALLNRKNQHLLKQSDAHIISVHILGKLLGFSSERAWHRFVAGNLFADGSFPERSRYNWRCRDLLQAIKWIRYRLVRAQPESAYTIIDSLPMPLCQAIRIPRIRLFKGTANRSYCASKRMYYYGFKAHMQVNATGMVLSYVITPASVHDSLVTEEVLAQAPHSVTLGDKGYIHQQQTARLQDDYGVSLCTPERSNCKKPVLTKAFQQWMRHKRKRIETTFSVRADLFQFTAVRSTSLRGFEATVETILLAHTLWITGVVEL